MAKITKPDISIQWAQAGSVSVPSDVKKQTGWTIEKPANEYMNWLQNRQDKGIAYSYQMGISEWDGTTEYQYASGYASYVQYNGVVYKAIQTGTNKTPSTETGYWTRAFDDYGAASAVNTALTNHITNYGTLASLSNVTTARSNLSVYSVAQCDATFAPIAGNSAQTFLVGTATSANHAIRKSQFDAKTGQATETTAGISEIATQAEVNAGADDLAYVTSLKLATNLVAKTASTADVKTGSSTTKFITPSSFTGFFNDSGQQGLTTEGYQKLPGGMIIQWGEGTNDPATPTEPTQSISFPISFPNAVLQVIVSTHIASATGNADCWYQTTGINNSGFTAQRNLSASAAVSVQTKPRWFAIGY